jgi:BatD DUF11 like domain
LKFYFLNTDVPALSRLMATGLVFFCLHALSAQAPPVFEATVESPEVVEGSRFTVTFTLKEGAQAGRLRAPDFAGFQVTGPPSTSTGMTIINGKVSKHQSWEFTLIAVKQGVFTIGPALLEVDRQTVRTQPLTIRVVKANAPAPGTKGITGDGDLFVVAELSKNKAFLGAQVIYQIRLYTRLTVVGYDILDLPDMEGCYTRELKRFDTRTNIVKLKGKEFATRILYAAAVFPQKEGTIEIAPANVRIVQERNDPFGGLFGGTSLQLQTTPVALRVMPLPQPVPPQFSGATGNYVWKVEADRDSLTTDEALTLSISIRGNGDPKRFAFPKFAVPDGFEVFDPKIKSEEAYENGQEAVHEKELTYVLFPKATGDYTLAPEMTIFNPDSNRYTTLRLSRPIPIKVTQGQQTLGEAEPLAVADQHPNTINRWLPWLAGLLAAALVLWLAIGRRRKRPEPAPMPELPPIPMPEPMPATPAPPTTQPFAQAQAALFDPSATAFFSALYHELQYACAARLQISAAQVQKAQLASGLTVRGMSTEQTATVLRIWDICEESLYAGIDHAARKSELLHAALAVFEDRPAAE